MSLQQYCFLCMQMKSCQEHNVKRVLCIGGSLAAVVVLILLMTGMRSSGGSAFDACGPNTVEYALHDGKDYVPDPSGSNLISVQVNFSIL